MGFCFKWVCTVYTDVLVDPADKLMYIFDPVILSSDIPSPYKSRLTSGVLACQFLKNFLSNNMIKIPQNWNHSCPLESHV